MSRPHPVLVPVLALLAALVVGGWWVAGYPRPAGPGLPDGRLASVSFAPFRPGQSPLLDRFPTAAEVEADLALLAPHVHGVRTYASVEGGYSVPELAARHGLKVWLGIWLGTDRAKNEAEITRGIELARAWPGTVERVVVGNEVLLRRDLSAAELVAAIDRVRAAVSQPVTYADVWEFWEQFPEVASHVDVITVHLLPYWEDQPTGVDAAVAHAGEARRRIAALFPGKPVAVGEAGWPSAGRPRGEALPGPVQQARFVREFVALSVREGFDYNLIEAFDQGWKAWNEGTVGAAWGLWTTHRQPKLPPSGPISPFPDWRAGTVSSVVLTLLLLGGTLLARPRLDVRAQCALAVLAAALGTGLACAHACAWPAALDNHKRLAAGVNLLAQLWLAVLLMRHAAGRLLGHAPPPARTGRDASEAVRRILRLRRPRPGDFGLDDAQFLFAWTAAVLALLLLFDPRYRDFPVATFAVPLIAVGTRLLLRDLPVRRGREEAWVGGTLALAAVLSLVQEGVTNLQAVAWTATALALAAPLVLPLAPYPRRPRPAAVPA